MSFIQLFLTGSTCRPARHMPGECPGLRDLSILFYMQNIETASFRVMMEVAHRLERPDVEQCLLECYDEAWEEKVLYRELAANCL